jgi:pyruvate,water dikinase
MKLLIWLRDINRRDILKVGGKAARLGELLHAGFPVPNGFVITTEGFFNFIIQNSVWDLIRQKLKALDIRDLKQLEQVSKEIREAINAGDFNKELVIDVELALTKLSCTRYAIRSSAIMEDEEHTSFAGQYDTFLDVKKQDVLGSIRKCWSSLFTPRAIVYRRIHQIPDDSVAMAVIVQEMIEADISGVIFTTHPIQKRYILVEAIYGRGEMIVSGKATPNSYLINKSTLKIMEKDEMEEISQELILGIAKLGQEIEDYYGKAQEVEFAVRGREIFILQSRPIIT